METLTKLTPLLLLLVVLSCAGSVHAGASDLAVLESIVADRDNQLSHPNMVTAAIQALGDMGSIDGARVLLDNIFYPRVNLTLEEMLAGKGTFVDVEGGDWSVGPDGRYWKTSNAFPAVRALVRIGPSVIPSVVERLAETDFDNCRNVYLDVLIELMDQKQVEALLRQEISLVQSEKAKERLQKALDIVPGLRPMMGLYAPDKALGLSVKPDSAIITGRTELREMAKSDIPPLVVVNDLALPRGSLMVDGVTLAPAKELASLLNVGSKQDGGRLVLSTAGPEPKSLTLHLGSTCALTASRPISLPTAPFVRGKELFVPLRAVAEYFGYKVRWDGPPMVAWVQ